MSILALGAGLLMAASIAVGAPERGAAVTTASSTAEECPSPRVVRAVHASRSLAQSGRRAVPPLKFPGFAASDRVALLPDVVPPDGRSRATSTIAALQSASPLLRPTVWASPRLPWA
jgi:hypothetical protein